MLAIRNYNGNLWDRVYQDLFDAKVWGGEKAFAPNTDVIENENNYEIVVEVPGFDEKDLTVTEHKGVLSIKGETVQENEEKDKQGNYLRKERVNSKFERKFILPDNADENQLSAKLEKGVLTLTLQKKVEEQPKQIEIK